MATTFQPHDNTDDPQHKQCQACGMGMKVEVKVCPFCQRDPDLEPLFKD